MSPMPGQASRSVSPTHRHNTFPEPKLLLHLDDLRHEGTAAFLSSVEPVKVLEEAVANVLKLLYRLEQPTRDNGLKESEPAAGTTQATRTEGATESTTPARAQHSKLPGSSSPKDPTPLLMPDSISYSTAAPTHPDTSVHPPVRSITLLVRRCGGVAYTTGKEIDDQHKEIHLNLDYIAQVSADRVKHEILGVLNHEMVHCWQWNANGTAPGGLIEGIADWVRLNVGLAPPHWKRKPGDKWDAGYEATGYFLDWLERHKCGHGTVRRLNAWMKGRDYDEDKMWDDICGDTVHNLWKTYQQWLEKHDAAVDGTMHAVVSKN